MSTPRADGADDLVLAETVVSDGAHVAVLTVNRPDQLNPLDHATIVALGAALDSVLAAGEATVVVVTGRGKAFSAGGDLKAYQELYRRPAAFAAFLDDFAAVCERLERGPLVSIAMINGVCVAGGLELALSCDLVTMAEEATIGDSHLRFGQLPGAGGSQRLTRALGPSRARAWILTGAHFSAATAQSVGLVADVAPAADLRARTLALAASIASFSPLALRHAKHLVHVAGTMAPDDGLAEERAVVHEYATTSFDATEGLLAFAERRPARYRGS